MFRYIPEGYYYLREYFLNEYANFFENECTSDMCGTFSQGYWYGLWLQKVRLKKFGLKLNYRWQHFADQAMIDMERGEYLLNDGKNNIVEQSYFVKENLTYRLGSQILYQKQYKAGEMHFSLVEAVRRSAEVIVCPCCGADQTIPALLD